MARAPDAPGQRTLLARSPGWHRVSALFGVLVMSFFLLVSLGAVVTAVVGLRRGDRSLELLGTLALGLVFARFVGAEVLTALRTTLLPLERLEGPLEHAAKVVHENTKRATPFWHLVIAGRELQVEARRVTSEQLLVTGRHVSMLVARDGEVLHLSADTTRLAPRELPPPSRLVSPLTADDLRRARAAFVRRVGGDALVIAASLGWVWFSWSTWLLAGLGLLLAVAFAFSLVGEVLALRRVAAIAPGTPAETLEGRYRRSVGVVSSAQANSTHLTVATTSQPHHLATKVRARGLTVSLRFNARSKTFVVVEWLASVE